METNRYQPSQVLSILSYGMSVLFFISVLLQYNDPDPIQWMLIYGAAAVLSFLFPRKKIHWGYYVAVIVAALAWTSIIAPDMWGKVAFGQMFESMKASQPQIEEARETGGLLIVTFWMAVLAFASRDQKKS
jgi:hypothetical protein